MEKRRAYALLWQWRASSRPLSSNHRSLLPNSLLTSRSSDSGSMFNFGRSFTSLSSFTEQQRQSFQQLLNILIDRRVLHQGTFLRSSNLPVRFYGSAPVERSASFSEINTKDITYFKSILRENNVIQDPDRLQPANTDWMHKYQGSSKLMLLPRTTEEVSHIMSTFVDLSNNKFDAASVPQWVEELPNLTTLLMANTSLEGNISSTLFNLPQIQTLVLNNNQLNGTVEIPANVSMNLRHLDLRNNSIDGFSSGVYNKSILLDENPFCLRPEAEGNCTTVQPSKYLNFIPLLKCSPPTCFSDPILPSDCKRPYLGNLVFRSFNFSDLANMRYYDFLRDTLQPLLSPQVSIDRVCLVSSMIDTNGYLVLNISFFPPGDEYFNRTGISLVGNVLNNHVFDSPYGPYYYIDKPYTFPGRTRNTALIIGVTVSGFVLLVLTIAAGVYAYRQMKIAQRAAKLNNPFLSWNKGNIPQVKGARWFSFEDVRQCTSDFSSESEIGVGGYGKVYKGKLGTGELVAIKRAQKGSMQGALEFKTEIELLSRVHHKNVVNLVGFCYDKGEQMLIYEYVPNGSLRAALSGKSGVRLDWTRRLNIALGAARGLAYLHELADPPIIHRDIKSDNILLTDHLNAKVADFGLSIPFSDDKGQVATQVKGTLGYLDPEYYMTQILTEKSDIYSFGVVMLELVTGKLPLEKHTYIVRVVRDSLKETGSVYNLVDPALRSDILIDTDEFVNLAMKCLQDTGDERPSMNEVVKEIESIIEASNMNYDVESTTTSASFDVTRDSGYPYNSYGSMDSRMSSPFIK